MNSVLIGSGVALMAVAVAGPAVLRKAAAVFRGTPGGVPSTDAVSDEVPSGIEGYVQAMQDAAQGLSADTIMAYMLVGMRPSQLKKFREGTQGKKPESVVKG